LRLVAFLASDWSNYYCNLRTAVPFVISGFLLEMRTAVKKVIKTKTQADLFFLFKTWLLQRLLFYIAEGGQF
jgi:hypothetical protein